MKQRNKIREISTSEVEDNNLKINCKLKKFDAKKIDLKGHLSWDSVTWRQSIITFSTLLSTASLTHNEHHWINNVKVEVQINVLNVVLVWLGESEKFQSQKQTEPGSFNSSSLFLCYIYLALCISLPGILFSFIVFYSISLCVFSSSPVILRSCLFSSGIAYALIMSCWNMQKKIYEKTKWPIKARAITEQQPSRWKRNKQSRNCNFSTFFSLSRMWCLLLLLNN